MAYINCFGYARRLYRCQCYIYPSLFFSESESCRPTFSNSGRPGRVSLGEIRFAPYAPTDPASRRRIWISLLVWRFFKSKHYENVYIKEEDRPKSFFGGGGPDSVVFEGSCRRVRLKISAIYEEVWENIVRFSNVRCSFVFSENDEMSEELGRELTGGVKERGRALKGFSSSWKAVTRERENLYPIKGCGNVDEERLLCINFCQSWIRSCRWDFAQISHEWQIFINSINPCVYLTFECAIFFGKIS